ncbi:MFS transporter, partial [Methylobacterium sp. J-092]|nr:MFS transporter [Methylobacterium sp. J-092]
PWLVCKRSTAQGLTAALAVVAAGAYGVFFLAAVALPATPVKVLHADR